MAANKEKQGITSIGKVYGLVPVDAFKGILHVIKNEYIDSLSNSNLRRNAIEAISGRKGSCTSDIFCVYHYYIVRGDMHDYNYVEEIH